MDFFEVSKIHQANQLVVGFHRQAHSALTLLPISVGNLAITLCWDIMYRPKLGYFPQQRALQHMGTRSWGHGDCILPSIRAESIGTMVHVFTRNMILGLATTTANDICFRFEDFLKHGSPDFAALSP